MELKVNQYNAPAPITFNYEELKKEIEAKCKEYEIVVYTEKQISMAKKDRATLNKLKDSLNAERIRLEREYNQPFQDFKTKVNEIIGIVNKAVNAVDSNVKEIEAKEKEDKLNAVEALFKANAKKPEWLSFEKINETRWWSNKSTIMSSVEKEMNEKIDRINADIKTLQALPIFAFESIEIYKETLDLNRAISEGQRLADIQKRKAEAEKAKAEAEKAKEISVIEEIKVEVPNNEKPVKSADWVAFEAYLTIDTAIALKHFFAVNHIEYRPIERGL